MATEQWSGAAHQIQFTFIIKSTNSHAPTEVTSMLQVFQVANSFFFPNRKTQSIRNSISREFS